jgi:hypothetical protein
MSLLCRIGRRVPEELAEPAVLRRHRARCLACQADAVRLRGLRRDLASLRGEVVPAPPGFHAAVMAGLADPGTRRSGIGGRGVLGAAAGAAVAAAAVAGGVALRKVRAAS